VIFDLFGTLVPAFSSEEAADGYGAVAERLGVDRQAFMSRWEALGDPRGTGEISVEDCFASVCEDLGVQGNLESFLELRRGFLRGQIVPFDGAAEALAAARSGGLRVGLLSNCSSDVPAVFAETVLAPLVDDAVFSCSVGLAKPDERIFRLAAERIGVAAESCLFVDDREENLEAARRVGMDSAPAGELSRLRL
jgi:putative hydrolase of the HAD superfamily